MRHSRPKTVKSKNPIKKPCLFVAGRWLPPVLVGIVDSGSKFPMQSRGKNGNRPAILVEGGIADELIIKGSMDGFPNLEIIIRLDDLFPAVIQVAITGQDAQAARRQKLPMRLGNAV